MYSILDLLSDLFNIHPVKASNGKGGEVHGPCPGCGGKDRFRVYTQQNDGLGSYWCRQECPPFLDRTKPRDNVQFLVDFKGMTYTESFKYLGKENNWKPGYKHLKTPEGEKASWQPTQHVAPNDIWQQRAWAFVDAAHDEILNYEPGIKWLAARGIGMDTIEKYKLGYHPGVKGNDQFRPRKVWGLPEEKKDTGKSKMVWLPIGLVIPCFEGDMIYRIRVRRRKEAYANFGSKYYIFPGSKNKTMILEPARKAFVVVEAELDALAIVEAVGDLAGAVSVGSLSNKPDVYATGKLRNSLTILNALDFEVGKKDGARAMQWWGENFENCNRWPVSKGKDPGEARQAGVDLREWVCSGLPPVMQMEKTKSKKSVKNENKGQLAGMDIPNEVFVLRSKLEGSGLTIMATEEELQIMEIDPDWKHRNWELFGEISDLVFKNLAVSVYIRQHPSTLIDAENIVLRGK